MPRYRKPKNAIRPVLMWAPVSPQGWVYHWAIRTTRAEAIRAWDANDPTGPSWARYRAQGWRMVRFVVTPFVDRAQLDDVEVQP